MTGCALCPRRCGANRAVSRGYCGSGEKAAHRPRGAPLLGGAAGQRYTGSGAIFFSGCTLGCVFCQNSTISAENAHGRDFDTAEFIALMQSLESEGAHNINLVTPTHFGGRSPRRCGSISRACRSSTTAAATNRRRRCAASRGSSMSTCPTSNMRTTRSPFAFQTPRTTGRRRAARCWRWCARPAKTYDGDGLLQRGVVVRHLILPAHTRNSLAVLDLLAAEFPAVPVSLMAQYVPMGRVPEEAQFADVNRRVTAREYRKVLDHMMALRARRLLSGAQRRQSPVCAGFHAVR